MMKLIAAIDRNNGIGKNGQLLTSIPNDMRFFRETTTGHVVVMGRKTLESFPGGKPLKNRVNIVMTRNPAYSKEGVIIVHNTEELEKALRPYPDRSGFVIGGESIYRELLDQCDTAYLTKIDHVYDADAFFPDIDAMPEWQCIYKSEEQTYFNLVYYFTEYRKQITV